MMNICPSDPNPLKDHFHISYCRAYMEIVTFKNLIIMDPVRQITYFGLYVLTERLIRLCEYLTYMSFCWYMHVNVSNNWLNCVKIGNRISNGAY